VPVSSQAFEVLVDSTGTNAYGILDLPVTTLVNEVEVTRFYDVTFRYEEGQNVYPNPPGDFDFIGETVFIAQTAVFDALNSVPAVTTVGPENQGGQNTFLIPIINIPLSNWFVDLTGEYLSVWTGAGINIIRIDVKETYADFTELPTGCTDDEDCLDDLFCNGEEACVDGECQDGPDPCTEDESCNEETNTCEPVPQPCECDLTDDGVCDMQDWFLFGQDWGRTDCPVP